jgi:hypothetical protein
MRFQVDRGTQTLIRVKGNHQMRFQVNPNKDKIQRIARSGSQDNQVAHSFDCYFRLKGIAIKTEFQINQVLRILILEDQFCLSLQNLLCKVFAL